MASASPTPAPTSPSRLQSPALRKNKAISRHCAVIGEVGLGGEVRRVSRTEVRLAEAAAVGMEAVILPESYRGRQFPAVSAVIGSPT